MAALPWRRKDYFEYFDRFLKGPGASFSKTRFGYAAVGEPSFLVNLQKGERKIQLATIERALDFVANFTKA